MLPGTSTLGTLAMELPPVDRTNLCCQRGSCNWSSCQSFLCLNFASGLKEKFYQRLKEGSELVPRGKAPRGTSTASQTEIEEFACVRLCIPGSISQLCPSRQESS